MHNYDYALIGHCMRRSRN